jgi:diguanylate cyclase (GGDEF)-like protein
MIRARRGPVLVCSAVIVATAALLPIGGHQWGPTPSYLPAVLAAVTCLDLLSVWLLLGEYRDSGDRRMLVTGSAYLGSLLVMVAYAAAFPGVVSNDPPLAITPSVAPYLYLGWHAGFPLVLGMAWLPWGRLGRIDKLVDRTGVLRRVVAIVGALAATYIALIVGFAHHLPVLIHGLNTSAMSRITAPIALPLVVASLAVCGYGIRNRHGVAERWAFVAITVCLCDLSLTYASHSRFSVGWYAGRTMTVISAAVVLVALLASFRRVKVTAETLAARDALTGLPNRRAGYDALAALIERASRMHSALAIVVVDLDKFKKINDRFGHAAGDAALCSAGDTMSQSLRGTDLIARTGGEEFLVLLPDADGGGARLTAERMRQALSLTTVPVIGAPVTASFGIATWRPGDTSVDAFVQRSDQAMYVAKAAGRDRVHLWEAHDGQAAAQASAAADLIDAGTAMRSADPHLLAADLDHIAARQLPAPA